MSLIKKAREVGTEKGRKHLTKSDYGILCDWLEIKENRDKVEGVEKKTGVGVRPLVRSKAYEAMAKHLNDNQKKGSRLAEVDGKSMKTRWRHYKNLYRATKALSQTTGFGLTEKDLAEGITTMDQKLDAECPWFSRMDAMYHKAPNVNPPAWHASQCGAKALLAAAAHDDSHDEESDAEDELGSASTGLADEVLGRMDGSFLHRTTTDSELETDVPNDVFVPDSAAINEEDLVPDSLAPELMDFEIPVAHQQQVGGEPIGAEHTGLGAPEIGAMDNAAAGQVPHIPTGEGISSSLPRPVQREDLPNQEQQTGGGRRTATQEQRPRGRRGPGVEGVGGQNATQETPRQNSPVPRDSPGDGNANRPADRGHSRSRSQSVGGEKAYPNKKQIGDNRHSINHSFSNNLETQNLMKERANELRAQKIEVDREMEQRRFDWQQELHLAEREDKRSLENRKLAWEMERFHEEKEQKASTEKLQMMLALIQNNKLIDEIKDFLNLLGRN